MSNICNKKQHPVNICEKFSLLVLLTDEDDAVVPENDNSLTSVTWTEDCMEVFDSSRADKDEKHADIASDEWCNSFTDDFSLTCLQPSSNVR